MTRKVYMVNVQVFGTSGDRGPFPSREEAEEVQFDFPWGTLIITEYDFIAPEDLERKAEKLPWLSQLGC